MFYRIMFITSLLIASTACLAQTDLEGMKSNNGKFGFTDSEGNWAIKPMYDEISEFYGLPFAFVKSKGKWGLIDQTNKTILPFEFTSVIFDEYLLGDEQNVIVVKNNKYGIVSRTTGKMLIDCIYEKRFEFSDGIIPYLGNLSVVYRNHKAGLLNEKGVEIVACQFDGGKVPFKDLYLDYYVTARQNNKVGVIDTLGRLVVPCVYDEVNASEDVDLLDVIKNKKHGLFSLTDRKELVEPVYDQALFFEGDYALVKQKKKYGAIDRQGKVVIPVNFTNDDEVFLAMEKLSEKN